MPWAFFHKYYTTVKKFNEDEDEKVVSRTKDSLVRENSATFLTENGVYEVLMLSRKPVAKEHTKYSGGRFIPQYI